jgi:hypothetical protein
MKKSVLLVLFITITCMTHAQIVWSVKGGPSINEFDIWGDGVFGGRIGLEMEYPINRRISIQPGLFLYKKGSCNSSSSEITIDDKSTDYNEYKSTVHLYYLEMPINAAFHVHFGNSNNGMQFAVGPYLAYAIDGHSTDQHFQNHVIKKDETISTFGKDGMYLRRFDLGVNFGIHFELGHFLIGNYFDLGITNINHDGSDDVIISMLSDSRNNTIGFEIGYKF